MSRKEENAKHAESWLERIDNSQLFSDAIERSKNKTFILQDTLLTDNDMMYIQSSVNKSTNKCEILITDNGTYEAALDLANHVEAICILNFASYFKPGGGFLKGAYTQEESLCHVSGLYPILSSLDVYKERCENGKNTPDIYRSEIIYSPSVPFAEEEDYVGLPILFDVLSCAAPNCNRVPISRMEHLEAAIDERLAACFLLPYMRGCEGLVLGAWGCGVFKNDPTYVASVFVALNKAYGNLYKRIVYALPNEKVRNIFSNLMKSECADSH